MSFHQVVELAPDVRQTGRFLNATIFVELVETGVGIGLKNAAEIAQMLLRMFSLAIGRVGKPHRRSRRSAAATIIANIGPEPARLRLPVSRGQHRNRRVVGVQLVSRHHIAAQSFDQWLQQAGWLHRPTWPVSSDPARRLRGRRSPTGDTTEDDHRTST